jgi:hypothetical protein
MSKRPSGISHISDASEAHAVKCLLARTASMKDADSSYGGIGEYQSRTGKD